MANAKVVLPGEIWKDVVGYEGFYSVSSFGRVYSVERAPTKTGHGMRRQGGLLMKFANMHNGYLAVTLQRNCKAKRYFVHRLVMAAFVGPITERYTVNHIDGIKINNRIENLEYATQSENNAHAFRIGLRTNSEPRSYNSLTDAAAIALLKRRAEGFQLHGEYNENPPAFKTLDKAKDHKGQMLD